MKLTPAQIDILQQLLFPEDFESILSETKMNRGALKDDLHFLMNRGLVQGDDRGSQVSASFPKYDIDHLHRCTFQATRRGMSFLSIANARSTPKF